MQKGKERNSLPFLVFRVNLTLGYPIPKNWAFDQFFEMNKDNGGKFNSTPSFDLDKDGYLGKDKGILSFDKVTYLTPDQLAEKNSNIMSGIQRDQFIYNVFEPLGYLNKVTNANITFEKEFNIETITTDAFLIEVTAQVSEEVTPNNGFDNEPITIELDSQGKLTASCDSKISGLATEIEIDTEEAINVINGTIDDLKKVAVSVTDGKIGFKFEADNDYPKLTFIVTSDDIFPDSDSVNQEITVEISFKIIPISPSGTSYEIDWVAVYSAGLTIAILGCIVTGSYYLIPGLLTTTGAFA